MQVNSRVEDGFARRAEELILTELTNAPVAEPTLKSRVRQGVRGLSDKDYKAIVNGLVAARKIHGRPKVGKNGRPTKAVASYVLGSPPPPPLELAPGAITDALRGGPLAPDALKRKIMDSLFGLSAKDYATALAEVLAAQRIHARPKLDKKGKPTRTAAAFAIGKAPPPDPSPFLQPVVESWRKASDKARAAGIPEASMLAALLSQLGVSSAALERLEVVTPEPGRERVLRELRELVAREGAGALIPVRQLRSAARLGKSQFDAAMLELRDQDTLILHHHDYVGSLSEAEQAELVVDAYGNYYVGVALRGGA